MRESYVDEAAKSIKAEELLENKGGGISARSVRLSDPQRCISTVLDSSSVLLSSHQGEENGQAGYPDFMGAYFFRALERVEQISVESIVELSEITNVKLTFSRR